MGKQNRVCKVPGGMSPVTVSALHIYPLKSARGLSLQSARIEPQGFEHDRRWMLVDADGLFVTQRQYPSLAQVDVRLMNGGATRPGLVCEAPNVGRLDVAAPTSLSTPAEVAREGAASAKGTVRIWDDVCHAADAGDAAAAYFSEYLHAPVRLVWMAATTRRTVDPRYATGPNDVVSFADGFPFLLTSSESLGALNSRLDVKLQMDRFRPNIVLSGALPFAEDGWKDILVGSTTFRVVKPCSRCRIVNVDQSTAMRGREPLATLATFRTVGNHVYFGQNLIATAPGLVAIGDSVTVL